MISAYRVNLSCVLLSVVLCLLDTSPALAASAAQVAEEESEQNGEWLILQATAGRRILSQGVSAWQTEKKELFISLYEISASLDFPIDVYADEQKAEGTIRHKNDKFYLSIDEEDFTAGDIDLSTKPDCVRLIEEDIFLSQDCLEQAFSIKITYDPKALLLDVSSDELLPFEQKQERQKRWKDYKIAQKQKSDQPDYPDRFQGYNLLTMPYFIVQLDSGFTHGNNGQVNATSGYYLQGRQDIFYMASEYFFSGNQDNPLQDSRFRFYRHHTNDPILESLDIKQIEVGDISAPLLPVIGGGGQHRGLYISNQPAGLSLSTNNYIIRGEAPPGWNVELYQNEIFIAVQQVSDQGRYEFSDIILEGGDNLFRIVKYGTAGQVEEESRRINFGQNMVPTGKFYYEAFAGQNQKNLLPLGNTNTNNNNDNNGDPYLLSNIRYGISEHLSAQFGLFSGSYLNSNTYKGLVTGLYGSVLGTFITFDQFTSNIDQFTQNIAAYRQLGPLHWSGFLLHYYGYPDYEILYRTGSNLSFSQTLFGTGMGIFIQPSFEKGRQNNEDSWNIDGRLSFSWHSWRGGNQIRYRQVKRNNQFLPEEYDGNLYLNYRLGRQVFQLQGYYSAWQGNLEFNDYRLRYENAISKNINLYSEANLQPHNNGWSVNMGSYIGQKHFALVGSGSLDHKGGVAVNLGLQIALQPGRSEHQIPIVPYNDNNHSYVDIEAYRDDNHNGQKDDTEVTIPDLQYKVHGLSSKTQPDQTSENTATRITGLPSFSDSRITLDSTSLPNLYMRPGISGYDLHLRSGYGGTFTFPITISGEIMGMIACPISKDLRVILSHKSRPEIQKKILPDWSGEFYIADLPTGKYDLYLENKTEKFAHKQGEITAENPVWDLTIHPDNCPAAIPTEKIVESPLPNVDSDQDAN